MITQPKILALVCGLSLSVIGCGDDDSGSGDTAADDTTAGDTMSQTTVTPDTGMADTAMADTSMADTSMADTSMADTSMADTSMADTGMTDTGMTDTGDTGMTDTGGTAGAALPATLNLMGYGGPHGGQDVHVKVFDDGDNEVGSVDSTVMADSPLVMDDAVVDGGTYTVRWWVDFSGNGTCDAPDADHSWEVTALVADAEGLSVDHMHDTNWTDVCGSWE